MTIKALYPTVRPSLNLDFAKTKALDPRITFSRASTATFVGADGLIKTAASGAPRFDHNPTTGESLGLLVEEARANLATYSDTAYAGGSNTTPYTAQAPNGTFTAVAFAPPADSNSGGTHEKYLIGATTGTIAVGNTVTVYAKMKPGSALKFLILRLHTSGWINYYNLETGEVTVSDSGMPGSMTSVGNGWWRCRLTNNTSAGAAGGVRTIVSTVPSIGNQTNGDPIYLWGLQNEAGSFPTSYIPTPATFTGRASTATFYDANGIIQTAASGAARSNAFLPDSNGVFRPVGLLLEAAGTNLLTYSEQFDNAAWVIFEGGTVTANTATAPDSTTTADTLAYDGANSKISITRATIGSLTIGTVYSQSFFVKVAGGGARYIQVWCTNGPTSGYANFDLNTSSVTQSTANVTPFIQKLANGWHRIGFSGATDVTNWQPRLSVVDSGTAGRNSGYSGTTASLHIWGAQLETSPFPTSYIPTVASTVTRAADTSTSATATRAADVASITGTNFSSWYNQSQGTVFSRSASFSYANASTLPTTAHFTDGTLNNYIRLNGAPSYVIRNFTVTGGVIQTQANINTAPVNNTPYSIALGLSTNNTKLYADGNSGATINPYSAPAVNRLEIGNWVAQGNTYLNGTISRLAYYPVRLPDAQLQALTR